MLEHGAAIVLLLFALVLGTAFGAGLFEARIEFPRWLARTAAGPRWDAEAARRSDTGRRFWAYVTTGPLTLLTAISLFVAGRRRDAVSHWWLAAAVVVAAERLFTFTFFIPTMVWLQSATDPTALHVVATARRWGHLNRVRLLMVLGAWLLALRALSLTGRRCAALWMPRGRRRR